MSIPTPTRSHHATDSSESSSSSSSSSNLPAPTTAPITNATALLTDVSHVISKPGTTPGNLYLNTPVHPSRRDDDSPSSSQLSLVSATESTAIQAPRGRAVTQDIEMEDRSTHHKPSKSLQQQQIVDLNLGDINENDIELLDVPVSKTKSVYTSQILAMSYVGAEMKRERRAFLVGLFTIFLVVMFTAVLQNGVLKSPLIFFKISENTVGENDLILSPGVGIADKQVDPGNTASGLPLLNQTFISQCVTGRPTIRGTTPRWVLFGRILQPKDRLTPTGENYQNIRSASSILLGMNSLQEKAIDLGRAWPFGKIGKNEVLLSRTIVRQIGLNPNTAVGQDCLLRLDLFDLARAVGIDNSTGNGATVQGPAIRKIINQLYPNATTLWNRTADLPQTDFNTTRILNDLANIDLTNQTEVNSFINRTLVDNWYTNFTLPQNALGNITTTPVNLNNTNLATLLNDLNKNLPSGFRQVTQQDIITLTQNIANTTLQSQTRQDLRYFQDNLLEFINGNQTYGSLFDALTPFIRQFTRIDRTFRIGGVVAEPKGKWPESFGSVTALEEEVMFQLFRDTAESFLSYNATGLDLGSVTLPDGTIIGPIVIPIPGVEEFSFAELLRRTGLVANKTEADRRVRSLQNSVRTFDENEYALLSVIQYTDRLSSYVKSLTAMNSDFIEFTNQASIGIGVDYPATWTIPIVTALQLTVYIRYFLDTIFGSIIALIVVLGSLLIYSLLLNDIESKTYEYGMLRALGMKNTTLIQLLLTKATAFAVPGIAVGLFIAFLINIPVAQTIAGFAEVPAEYTFFASAVGVATVIGFVLPLLANVVPISRALGKTLRDALDIYHHAISDVTVKVIKLAELGLDLWQTAVALLLVAVGGLTFYGVPYAFTFGDIPLLLGILNAILLGMLFGLCLMAQMIQPFVERAFLWCMCFPYHRHLYGVVKKNLAGHRGRNRKTALMFTLCLGFIIFAGVMFSLQSASLSDNVKVLFGADINISALPKALSDALDEKQMSAYLDEQMRRRANGDPTAIVLGYTFVTFALNNYPGQELVWFSNLAEYPEQKQTLYGVHENYLDVAYDSYFQPKTINKGTGGYSNTRSGLPDAVKMMYQFRGQSVLPIEGQGIKVPPLIVSGHTDFTMGVDWNTTVQEADVKVAYTEYIEAIFSEAIRPTASVGIDTPMHLYTQQSFGSDSSRTWHNYLVKPRAFASKVPGFFYSSYRQTIGLMNVIIPMDQFDRIYRDRKSWTPSVDDGTTAPKWRLLIRVVDGADADLREDVVNGLRPFFASDKIVVTDTQDIVGTLKVAADLMSLFFQVVGVIAMVMCFFILWLSFTANVRENAWEFGVLRACGLNGFQSVMVYIYEALALVLASVILGTGIGILIAASLTLQFNLFTEMPFKMEFPHALFWSMFSLSVIVAIVGSATPARHFLKKSIANVIRGN